MTTKAAVTVPVAEPGALVGELAEADARGAVAEAYRGIRALGAVPMVALIWRHLATMPGALEWCWATMRPALERGAIQQAAWLAAERSAIADVPPIPAATLAVLGLDAAAHAGILGVLDAYNRANPVNIVSVRCLARLLEVAGVASPGVASPGVAAPRHASAGQASPGLAAPRMAPAPAAPAWAPPAPLAALPPMVAPDRMDPPVRALVALLADRGGPQSPILPSLYRHLAPWPAMLALAATIVPPRFDAVDAAAQRMRDAAQAAAAAIAPTLAPSADVPLPDAATRARMLAAFEAFSPRIPEMVAIGMLLRRAMPVRPFP